MYQEITDSIKECAEKAGKILLEGFGKNFKISNKEGKNNLVTEYDTRSEDFIIDFLGKRFPDSYFLAEESGTSGKKIAGKIKWVIDPLDGTVNYAHTIPIFSVSIAAEIEGEIVSGAVYSPSLDDMFFAEKGAGAYLNEHKLQVSENGNFDKAFLVTGFPYNVKDNPCNCVDHFVSVIKNGSPIRRLGSAALDLAYVAAGRFDGFWEIDLHPWDVAAGVLLVREAGGKVTGYDQTEYSIYDRSLLATNGTELHAEIANQLNRCTCG